MKNKFDDPGTVIISVILMVMLAAYTYLIANMFFEISFLKVFFLEIISFFGRSFLNFISRKVLLTKL
ncbi:hypothetical protein EB118_10650 [bacterium]|nr:hypothetical protein [bacterium]NDD82684.1 hypothetical protein [bacterium]NDG30516.1 hypothetical protein [bacterium]